VTSGYFKLHLPWGSIEVTGTAVTIIACALGIIGANLYQTSAIKDSLEHIAKQHEYTIYQQEKISRKVGLIVLGQFMSDEAKKELPIVVKEETKEIIAENAKAEAEKAIKQSDPMPPKEGVHR
jgi:hypothetical protein